MSIYKAYDIRGVYPDELDEAHAEKIGKAVGTIYGGTIVIGMDARTSGPTLKEKIIEGLRSVGANVVDIGLVSTPMLTFAVGHYGFDAGMMITASHNPKQYNGVKLYGKGAVPISFEAGLNKVKRIVENGTFKPETVEGTLSEQDIEEDYTKFILENCHFDRPLKVVIDAGNGSGGWIATKTLSKAGFDVVPLFCDPNGEFPNHHPNPEKEENLKSLQEKVKETSADIGLAFDGDADRLGLVDEKGDIIPSPKVFSLLIEDVLEKRPNSSVVYDVLASDAIKRTIEKSGGKPIVSKVGHTFIAEKMKETGSVLGGEVSGHYYFEEAYDIEDALLAAMKIMELVAERNKTISELADEIPDFRFFSSRTHWNNDKKDAKIDELKVKYAAEGFEVLDLDGVKVFTPDGWFIVRPSNTEPALVYGIESETEEGFKKLKFLVEDELGI